jgi:biopolymer transport protein ExbD
VEFLANGDIRLDGRQLPLADFRNAAAQVHSATRNTILIQVADHTAHTAVVRVMDEARQAGFTDQIIATEPRAGGPPRFDD